MSLIEKMHEMYSKDEVTADILAAAEQELEGLENNLHEIEQNRLLNFTTFFLDVIEAELGITEKGAALAQRRDEVRSRLLSRGKVSIDGVRNICGTYLTEFEVRYYPDEYRIVILSEQENSVMQDILRAYVPAHILIEYSKKLRTYGELEVFTHGHLSEFTHDEIREKWVL